MKVYLGEYTVVDTRTDITIDLGKGVSVHVHTGDYKYDVRVGDKIPLFTEIPLALPLQTPK